MTTRELFRGPASVRFRHEGTALVGTIVVLAFAIPSAGLLSEFLSWHSLAIVAVVGMVFVTLSRGRLLGTSVRVHAEQFPETFALVADCARKLGMPVPHIFIRDDDQVPIAAVGIGEPYSLVISTKWIRELQPDELAFIVGRELAHVAAGHTRFTSVLSVNGRENAVIAFVFGAWLRRLEYTADRVGFLVCGSLAAAHRAIAVTTFHTLGRTVDLARFAEQRRELEREPNLRMGEWLGATPYAVHRISEIDAFAATPLAARWSEELTRGLQHERRFVSGAAGADDAALERSGYAGFWRRVGAWAIDVALCGAILPQVAGLRGVHVGVTMTPAEANELPEALRWLQHSNVTSSMFELGLIAVYVIVMVGLMGQTFGMLVTDLRVVDVRLQPVGILRAVVRYACLAGSICIVYPLFRVFGRIQPFEKWSGTRLVQARALDERRAAIRS